MSANRDKTQRVAFVYTNFYQLYRKSKDGAQASPIPGAETESGSVLKAGHVAVQPAATSDAPASVPAPSDQAQTTSSANPALDSLKDNLKSLQNLHERLRFMLQELEDLVKN